MVYDLIALRNHPASAAITAKDPLPISTSKLIDQWGRLRRLVYADNPEQLSTIAALLIELREVADDRHAIVHSFWPYGAFKGDKTIELRTVKPQRGNPDILEFRTYTVSVEMLDGVNKRMIKIYHRLLVGHINLSADGHIPKLSTIDTDD